MGSDSSRKQPCSEYLPDSPEQIVESMERLGPLRDKLYGALQDAIARVNQGQQESSRPPIGASRDDPKDDDLLR